MDYTLEILKLKIEIAKLKLAVELQHGKSLNPAYKIAEIELQEAADALEEYELR